MSEPRVSLLLPARNAEITLPACLASLARQSEERWECVLVDDGSKDDTGRIAAAAAARDPRVRVVEGPGTGLVDALARGLVECRAPLVARMDADDWMRRARLALQCAALDEDPGLAGVGSHVRFFPRSHLGNGGRAYERWLNGVRSAEDVRRERYVECPIAHPTWMLRREVLDAHGYEERGWPEDYDLLLRLLAAGYDLGVVTQRLVGWREGPERSSRVDPRYSDASFTACKAEHLARDFLADAPEYVLWGYGSTGRALRRELETRGRTPSRIVEVHPRRIGQRIHGAPVIPPEDLPAHRGSRIVVSVAGAGPRGLIRKSLAEMGFLELVDYVCAA